MHLEEEELKGLSQGMRLEDGDKAVVANELGTCEALPKGLADGGADEDAGSDPSVHGSDIVEEPPDSNASDPVDSKPPLQQLREKLMNSMLQSVHPKDPVHTLHELAASGSVHQLEKHLLRIDREEFINSTRHYPRDTALHLASAQGDVKVVELLLSCGADADATNEVSETSLHQAARAGHTDVTRLLGRHCKTVDPRNMNGDTPLLLAAAAGHVEVIRVLLTQGANVSTTRPQDKQTPLHKAARRGHMEVVDLLLENGAEVAIQDLVGMSAKEVALMYQNFCICLRLEQEHKNRSTTAKHSESLLLLAAQEERQKQDAAEKLLMDERVEELRRNHSFDMSTSTSQSLIRFSHDEVRDATREFDKDLQLVWQSPYEHAMALDGDAGDAGSHGRFFGQVYRCWLRGFPVVVKRLTPESLQGIPALSSEIIQRLSAINSAHTANLLGWCPEPLEEPCLIYELCNNGSVSKQLTELLWLDRTRIVTQIARALAHVHLKCSESFVHYGLHPDMVLLDQRRDAKLVEVGIPSILPPAILVSDPRFRQPLAYADPARKHLQQASTCRPDQHQVPVSSDVYSLGMILLQALVGRSPTESDLISVVQEALVATKGRIFGVTDPVAGVWPTELATALARIALKCTRPNPKERPSLEHELLPQLENALSVAQEAPTRRPLVSVLASSEECVACPARATHAFMPCGHLCACLHHTIEIVALWRKCPQCAAEVQDNERRVWDKVESNRR